MSKNIFLIAKIFILFVFLIVKVIVVFGQETIFHEDFEKGQGNWWADNGVWNVGIPSYVPSNAHSGQNVAGTVLDGYYPDYANTRLISPEITLPNLLSGERLQLKFWHWFDFSSNTQGIVQISLNGGSWQNISNPFIGDGGAWSHYIVDLSEYANLNIRISFYFTSGSSNDYGWYIDDVKIVKGVIDFRNPEDFEVGINNWWADNGIWNVGIPSYAPSNAHSGQNVAGTVLDGYYPDYANTRLISPEITLPNLSSGERLQLKFWHWFDFASNTQGIVQISLNRGSWQNISNPFIGDGRAWSQHIVELSEYVNLNIRISFYFTSGSSNDYGWYIDDIMIDQIISSSISVAPTSVNFNNVLVGQTATDTLIVTNTGTKVLNVGPINIIGTNAGNFNFDTSSFNLATSESKILPVYFTPNTQGNFNATLNINSNGGNVSINLNGNGIIGNAPMVSTTAATNITTTSATLNGTVNPNGLSTTVKFQYGTSTNYGSEISATPSPVTGTSIVSVSSFLNGLTPNTIYHYRITATNSVGTTNGADQTFTTASAGNAPTVTTNSATDVTTSSAILNGIVNPNGLSTTIKFHYGTTTSYGNEVTATPSPVAGTSTTSVTAQLTGLSPNTLYHFRLVATNSTGTTQGTDQTFTTLAGYPSTLTLNNTVNFPAYANASDYNATDYRIIGLPGASNLAVNELLQGTQNQDWQIFWDNGEANNYFVEFDAGTNFMFSVGRAFWLIHKGPWNINTTVSSAPLNASQQAEIPLHHGWNLMTNPFMFSMSWSTIKNLNGLTDPIWSYNGSFSESSSFEPYIGYYLFNATNLSSLKIPYSSYVLKPSNVEDVDTIIWRVNICLSSGDFIDQTTSFGVSNEASKGLDHLDFRKPRLISPASTILFQRPEWDAHYSSFATDIRPIFEETESWEFEVFSYQRKTSKLAFSGLWRIPNQFNVYLIDQARAEYVNLRDDSLYFFTPTADISKFCVVVGKEDLMKDKLGSIIPAEFFLGNNYPNPFNASTTIPVIIPATSDVMLKVYNILGEEIKTIYAGTLETGRFWFNYDGKDETGKTLGSGIYLYCLIVNNKIILTGRMILLN